MKKPEVILIAAQSLDGYIAKDRDDQLKWVPKQDHILYRRLTIKIKHLIVGYNTFKLLPKKAKEKRFFWVLTSKKIKTNNAESIRGEPHKILKFLSAHNITTIGLIGGQSVYTQFLQQNLVDKIYLSIIPIFLGNGIKLFNIDQQIQPNILKKHELAKMSKDDILKDSLYFGHLKFRIIKVEQYKDFIRIYGKKINKVEP